MPNRIIRDGILKSKRIDSLSADAEIFYRRLMSVVDDYGRFEADETILLAALYPRRVGQLTVTWLSSVLHECAKCGGARPIVSVYEVSGDKYLQVNEFNQRRRAPNSKFPPPTSGSAVTWQSDDGHATVTSQTNDGLVVVVDECVVECVVECVDVVVKTLPATSGGEKSKSQIEIEKALNAQQRIWFQSFYQNYWRKKEPIDAAKAFGKHVKTEQHFQQLMFALGAQQAEMLSREPDKRPYPASWINAGSWLEDPENVDAPQIQAPKKGLSAEENGWGMKDLFPEEFAGLMKKGMK